HRFLAKLPEGARGGPAAPGAGSGRAGDDRRLAVSNQQFPFLHSLVHRRLHKQSRFRIAKRTKQAKDVAVDRLFPALASRAAVPDTSRDSDAFIYRTAVKSDGTAFAVASHDDGRGVLRDAEP